MTHPRLLSAVSPLVALAMPNAANADPRYANRAFVANEIVTIHARPGIESAVAFDPDEHIENIAVGNSSSWEVSPNKRANVVFVKPRTVRARTNMTVITDQRTYLFDLVSSAATDAVYMMHFRYPDAPKRAAVVAPAAAAPGSTALAEAAPAVLHPAPVELNFAWRGGGEKRLLPASYFDDGASTFLRWPGETTLPAILVRGPDGKEGPVNYTVKGDYIVVEGVPAQLVLRSGKQVATLTPMPRPAPAPTRTASAGPPPLQNVAGKTDR